MAQQLSELGNPNGINIWATKPQTPGALGNNAMAARPPAQIAAPPKFINSLMSAGQGLANAAMAPGNALMGNYQPTVDPSAPGGVDPYSGMIPDATNLAGMVTLGAGAAPADTNALNMGIRAYHGSPHSFAQFDMSKIGTGEGAQAYGHGLYFAGNEGVAQGYRSKLAQWTVDGKPADASDPSHIAAVTLNAYGGNKDKAIADLVTTANSRNPAAERAVASDAIDLINSGAKLPVASGGHMYAVDINADPSQMLDWDKPLSEQSADVVKKLGPLIDTANEDRAASGVVPIDPSKVSGREIYGDLSLNAGGQAYRNEIGAAAALHGAGIPGIQYLDAGSRETGDGTKNYVVFDDKLINILKKYGIAGPIAGGATAAALSRGNQLTTPAAQPANPLIGQIGT